MKRGLIFEYPELVTEMPCNIMRSCRRKHQSVNQPSLLGSQSTLKSHKIQMFWTFTGLEDHLQVTTVFIF